MKFRNGKVMLTGILLAGVLTVGMPKGVQAASQTEPPLGDVNMDNRVDAEDALAILKHTVHLELADETFADVDGNGVVNAMDALLVLKSIVGLENHFPAESYRLHKDALQGLETVNYDRFHFSWKMETTEDVRLQDISAGIKGVLSVTSEEDQKNTLLWLLSVGEALPGVTECEIEQKTGKAECLQIQIQIPKGRILELAEHLELPLGIENIGTQDPYYIAVVSLHKDKHYPLQITLNTDFCLRPEQKGSNGEYLSTQIRMQMDLITSQINDLSAPIYGVEDQTPVL